MTATLHFELPSALVINANHREHHHPRAAKTRTLRDMGRKHAMGQKVGADRAELHVSVGWSRRGKHDAPNLFPTVKAITDGAVDAGLLVDDSDDYILLTTFAGYVAGKRGITIIDLRFEPAEEDA